MTSPVLKERDAVTKLFRRTTQRNTTLRKLAAKARLANNTAGVPSILPVVRTTQNLKDFGGCFTEPPATKRDALRDSSAARLFFKTLPSHGAVPKRNSHQ
jgi:hypothetical protein